MTKITIDRAVVEQALEALEFVTLDFFMLSPVSPGRETTVNAITALRAALATHQESLQIEPVQPVAWVRPCEQELSPEDAFSWVETALHTLPLYTAPPQRKPLSDEEIKHLAIDVYSPHQEPLIVFARAIERKVRREA